MVWTQGAHAADYLAQRTPGMGLPTPALAGLLRQIHPATPASGQQARPRQCTSIVKARHWAQFLPICVSSALRACSQAGRISCQVFSCAAKHPFLPTLCASAFLGSGEHALPGRPGADRAAANPGPHPSA